MRQIRYQNVNVIFPDEMCEKEALEYLKGQQDYNHNVGMCKPMIALGISIVGNEVELQPHYDTVVRVRRITGYISNVRNFNDAKLAELHDRVAHTEVKK